jgi:hypothetical protein
VVTRVRDEMGSDVGSGCPLYVSFIWTKVAIGVGRQPKAVRPAISSLKLTQ